MAFQDLVNGFYNGLTQGLGISPQTPFQIIQPAPAIDANDINVWAYFNNIPPFSLTQNFIASGGNQFYSDYKAVLSALRSGGNSFQTDIGDACFAAWLKYLGNLAVKDRPSLNTMGQTFLNWAMVEFPSVASKGASDLGDMALDPITSAQFLALAYKPAAKVPDWITGYNDLTAQLAKSEADRKIHFEASTASSDVSQTWTGGQNSAFFGLWTSSHSESDQSSEFASADIILDASFEQATTFTSSPGEWYSSAALALALSDKTGPWNPNSFVNWDNTFGPGGNMQRFCSALVVVSGMKLTIQSAATFSSADQRIIQSNKQLGLWPFYTADDGSSAHNDVSFDSQGKMTITTTTKTGIPVVIGCIVVPAAQYLGHANSGLRRLRASA